MSDVAYAEADTGSAEPFISRSIEGDGPIDIRAAARAVAEQRVKELNPSARAPVEAAPEAAQESAGEADGAPQSEAPAEPQGDDQAPEAPPIDPPRSWTKDEKERFRTLPRETQEYLANREQERDRDIRTRQNELAQRAKALEAEAAAAQETRRQYEANLPALQQALEQVLVGEFADIRTMQDVQKMAAEDWPRYIRWDAAQKQVAAAQEANRTAQARQQYEAQSQFAKFAQEQDRLFAEKVPDFKDKAVAERLQTQARDTLVDLGFSAEELSRAWLGQDALSLRDHRVQLLIRDAIAGRELAAEKAKGLKNATTKPLPPVQRPGSAPVRGQGLDEQIKSLQQQQESATGNRSLQLGAEILKLQRQKATLSRR